MESRFVRHACLLGIVITFWMAASAVVWAGNIYFVATTGNNANDGSEASPWATPGYGASQLKAGDTLIIKGGRYSLSQTADILAPNSGDNNNWITIRGEDANRPVLAGRNNLIAAIDLSGKSYIRLENLEITSDETVEGVQLRNGITVSGRAADHLIFSNLKIHRVDEFGIGIADVDTLKILACEITYCGDACLASVAGTRGGWVNATIRGCTIGFGGRYYQGVVDNPNNPSTRRDGIFLDVSTGPVSITNTSIQHCQGNGVRSQAAMTSINASIIANNVADGVRLAGDQSSMNNVLIYGRGDGAGGPNAYSPLVIDTSFSGRTFTVMNLTIDDVLGNSELVRVQKANPTVPANFTAVNCIFSGRGPSSPVYLADSVIATTDYNLFYMPTTPTSVLVKGSTTYDSTTVLGVGTGTKYGDPLFTSKTIGAEDYRLQAGSPALNSATTNGTPATDLDGNPRPWGSKDTLKDIGAYEKYNGTGGVPVPSFTLPATIDLGTISIGTRARREVSVQVSSKSAGVKVSTILITGTNAFDFFVENDVCSGRLVSTGDTATFDIVFAPTTIGDKTATLSISSNIAGSPTNVTLTGSAGIANISVTPGTANDFGSVATGKTSNPQTFTVAATGTVALTVGTIGVTGPNAADFKIQNDYCSGKTISPGSPKQFDIVFSPTGKGARTATVTIPSNDPDTPEYYIPVTGTGLAPKIAVSPSPYDFGGVAPGNTARNTFTVTNAGDGILTMGNLSLVSGEFQLDPAKDYCSGFSVAPGDSATFDVVFAPTSFGTKNASVSIPSNDPDTPNLTVQLTGSGGVADISVSPASKDFGTVGVGSSSRATFTVTNSGEGTLKMGTLAINGTHASEFRIENDNCSNNSAPKGDTRTFEVVFSPTSAGAKSANVAIPSNDPDTPTLNVPLTASGEPPNISVAPTAKDFGAVGLGMSSRATFTVSNSGGGALAMGNITISGANAAEFKIENDNCSGKSIQKSGTATFDVVYTPTTLGTKTATVAIPSNDPDTPTLNVPLTGSALNAVVLQLTPVSPAGTLVILGLDNGTTQKLTLGANGGATYQISPKRKVKKLTMTRKFNKTTEAPKIQSDGLSGVVKFNGKLEAGAVVKLINPSGTDPSVKTDINGAFSFGPTKFKPTSVKITKSAP